MTKTEQTERERLIQFMAERQLDHKDLARQMKWSPTYIYGAIGGAWSLTDSFRWTFAKTFGFEAAAEIFNVTAQVTAQPAGATS